VQLALGGQHACSRTRTGGIRCWGYNSQGQLGDGTTTDRPTQVDVTGLGAAAVDLSAGGNHTCAVLVGGIVRCWGMNTGGVLGPDGPASGSAVPITISSLPPATATAAAWESQCALLAGGAVQCWGRNTSGQLGNGMMTDSAFPVVAGVSSATMTSGGGYFACALVANGGIRCWGSNASGQLGNGMGGSSSTPVAVVPPS
jgi:hypothetical protein